MMDRIMNLKGREPDLLGHDICFKCSIVLPVVDYEGKTCVLFEERSHDLTVQPGEICFPGGKIESSDNGAAEAAIRETCEELGLSRQDIELIANLDVLATPFNAIIYPFVAEIKEFDKIYPNHSEVASIFCVPVDYLMASDPMHQDVRVKLMPPSDYPFELIPQGKDYPWREGYYPQYFYRWQNRVIWGLTARILKHFLDLI
ncbi:MAG: NUDIX hydrolase [Chitinophagales bacterium]